MNLWSFSRLMRGQAQIYLFLRYEESGALYKKVVMTRCTASPACGAISFLSCYETNRLDQHRTVPRIHHDWPSPTGKINVSHYFTKTIQRRRVTSAGE